MHSRTVVGEGLLWAKGQIILLSLNVFGDVHPKTRIWRGDHNLPLDKQWLNSFPIYPCLGVSWVTCYWPLSETQTQAGSHLYHHWDLVGMRASWLAGCLTQSVTGMGWRSGMDKQTKCNNSAPVSVGEAKVVNGSPITLSSALVDWFDVGGAKEQPEADPLWNRLNRVLIPFPPFTITNPWIRTARVMVDLKTQSI